LIYLFDRYELDDDNLCLSRDGQRLALEPRAFAVLLVMVRSQGRLLKKDAILEAVWQKTVVEESSLSRAVALLRKQLGDDPRRPRFIETVPTLGYRFIAEVRQSSQPLPSASAAALPPPSPSPSLSAPSPPSTPESPTGPAPFSGPAPTRRGVPRGKIFVAGVLAGVFVLLAATAAMLFAVRQRSVPPQKRLIVLAEFDNSTGEAVFDGTLRQGLTVQLEQSPLLSLLSERRIASVLKLMGQDSDARLTPALAREVCGRTGSFAVLDGSIAKLGTQYVVGLRATQCATGEVLDTEQVQAERKEEILRTLGQMASSSRTRLGESLNSISSHDMPLEEATTSSLEALKAYSDAHRVQNTQGSAAAIPAFQQAIALDPQFALAHAMLGRMYGDLGQETLSAESTVQAYQFRNRASERERSLIIAAYQTQVTGNLELAEATCKAWAQNYPRDEAALGFQAGLILRVFGRYADAAAIARRVVEFEPDFAMGYHLFVINLISLGRFTEAQAALERAAAHHLEMPQYLADRYRLAFISRNEPEMKRLAALAWQMPSAPGFVAGAEASVLAFAGRNDEARDVAQRAVTLALQLGRRDAAARLEAAAAVREALLDNVAEATRHATAALGLSNGRDAEYGAALALALVGDSETATRLAQDLEQRLPEDTAVRFHYTPAIRAQIALNRGDGAAALQLLKANSLYELGSPPSNFTAYYGVMYPVFVRGRVYLALRRGVEAAQEFQKILDHPAIVVSDPIYSLTRLELGRAFALSGESLKAKAAYAGFFAAWKNADAKQPLLEAAQAEYARL